MKTSNAVKDSEWVLDTLIPSLGRDHRRVASLILGFVGPVLFAVLNCTAAGVLLFLVDSIFPQHAFLRAMVSVMTFLFMLGCYFAVVLALQVLASCQLPLSARLLMIYATTYGCLAAASWFTADGLSNISIAQVLSIIPLGLGGIVMRWIRGWRSVSWDQPVGSSRLTIFSLLDFTSATAILLGLMTLSGEYSNSHQWVWQLGGSIMLAVIGLHVWTRLSSLSPVQQYAGTGFGIWMAVNLLLAFLVFVSFAVSFSSSPAGLLGFVAAPASLLVAHVWTEVPLRWLRGCGWRFVRASSTQSNDP